MDDLSLPLVILVGFFGVAAIGAFLIESYFRRKEEFVDRLQAKAEGNTDAT